LRAIGAKIESMTQMVQDRALQALTHGLLACIGLLLAGSAMAQVASADCVLRIASGPGGKVYERMVRDMQAVCGSSVSICSAPSSGGLQNLGMLSANEAEMGIAQVDTLKEMASGDENIRDLQTVLPLHANLLHVIAASEGSLVGVRMIGGIALPGTGGRFVILRFSDLKGMTVAVVGSAQLLGQTLERQLAYGMKFVVADSDDHALDLLRQGYVQAVFTLGGWPLPTVSRLKAAHRVQLVDFNLEPHSPYMAVKRNYQNLDAFNVNFLAVPNVLLTRPFKPGGSMATKVAKLQSCLKQHLDALQDGRYQPSWKEIKDVTSSYGISPFAASTKLVTK
jgi:TRAP-type uncharacterized transport system substrate-binding protein